VLTADKKTSKNLEILIQSSTKYLLYFQQKRTSVNSVFTLNYKQVERASRQHPYTILDLASCIQTQKQVELKTGGGIVGQIKAAIFPLIRELGGNPVGHVTGRVRDRSVRI
jgi:hypothetical protein